MGSQKLNVSRGICNLLTGARLGGDPHRRPRLPRYKGTQAS